MLRSRNSTGKNQASYFPQADCDEGSRNFWAFRNFDLSGRFFYMVVRTVSNGYGARSKSFFCTLTLPGNIWGFSIGHTFFLRRLLLRRSGPRSCLSCR